MKSTPKYILRILIFTLITGIIACGSQQTAVNPEDFDELRKLVESRKFAIEQTWANPMGGGMINLIDNPNHIRVKGDSVDVFLPYFGVRHMGGGYGSEGGIRFEGVPSKFNVKENRDRQRIIVSFEAGKGTENLQFSITLFTNGNANTSVNSSQRNSISYQGELVEFPKQQESE